MMALCQKKMQIRITHIRRVFGCADIDNKKNKK